jgi:CHAT domain-containing protein/tetratricopeptide (TPR) repeat protein
MFRYRSTLSCLLSLWAFRAAGQTRDVEASLGAIETELNAVTQGRSGNLSSLESRLTAICRDPANLPKCQLWAIQIALQARETDRPERLAAIATPLDILRGLHSVAPTPESAAVEYAYGRIQTFRGSLEVAAESLRRALSSFELLFGRDSPTNLEPILKLGEVYYQQAKYSEARTLLERAVDLTAKSNPSGVQAAEAMNDMGLVYEANNDLPGAESMHLRALDIRRKLQPPQELLVANSLNNLGQLYDTLGEYRKAMASYEEALSLIEKTESDEHMIGVIAGNIGNADFAVGDFARAEQHYRRSLTLIEKTRGPRSKEAAAAVGNLASLYASEGAFSKAEGMKLKSLGIREALEGRNHPDSALAYNNLGALYFGEENYAKAAEAYRTALGIYQKLPDRDVPGTAATLDNLARDLAALGRYAEAEPLAIQALSLRDAAASAYTLGHIYIGQRKYAEAEPLLLRALSAREKASTLSDPDTIFERLDYSRDLWQLGKRSEARDQLIAANRELIGFWSRNLTAVEDARRRSLAHKFDDLLNLSLTMAADLSGEDGRGAATLATFAISARKGISSSASREVFARIRGDQNREALALLGKLTKLAEQEGYWSQSPKPDAPAKLETLRRQRSETEKLLIDKSGAYRQWRAAVEVPAIVAHIPHDAAFIDTVRYKRLDWVTGLSRGDRYAAIIYSSGHSPRFMSLGMAEPIDVAVKDLRKNFTNMWRYCVPAAACPKGVTRVLLSGPEFQANLTSTQAGCTAIYKLIMATLRAGIGGWNRLLVAPDGALAEIPWEIMRDERGRYLVEAGYRIAYIDSARSLVYPTTSAKPRSPAVVIADVDYDGVKKEPMRTASIEDSSAPPTEIPAGDVGGNWKRLQGGAEVLQTIRQLSQAGKIGPVEKLPMGSEDEVKALNQPAAVIAYTHGFFHAGSLMGQSEGLDSGIVLYGANRAAGADGNETDGILLANEAMLLKLDGTRLVALFGCDTGRSVEAGEGVQGFRHALAVAGARSSVLTLWEVGDLSTARFLREFLTRASPASLNTIEEALAATQVAFLRGEVREPGLANRWNHPYFWAAATFAGKDGLLDLSSISR